MSTPSDLMRHALGVQDYGGRWSKPYRNHFVAGGNDAAAWRELVRGGLAVLVSEGNERTGGDPVFAVSFLGQSHALAGITFKRRYGYGRPVNL